MAQHNTGSFEKVRALAAGARVLVIGGAREGASSQLTFYDAVSHKRVTAATAPSHVLGLTLAGEVAVAACADGTLRLYKAGTGEHVRDIPAHQGAATAVAALADGQRVVSAGADGSLRLFAVGTGKKLGEWELSSLPLRAAAADPGGEYVAGAGDDGVVRVVTLADGARRDMAGHDGPVTSLAFTPRDGRLISGGDDGLLRIWFLVGDVECEVRGKEDGHKGAVRGLLFLPQPKARAGAEDPGDRFVSVGDDGKAKFWRLEDRRKPRTIDVQGDEPAHAVAFARITRGEQFGLVFVGGERRSIDVISVDTVGVPGDTHTYGHGFTPLTEALSGNARPAAEAAVRELASLDEPEALDLLLSRGIKHRVAEVQELTARELGRHGRVKARPALREALSAGQAPVRAAAYEALTQIEGATSPAAARAALDSTQPDLRIRALGDLAKLHKTSPLVGGLIAGKLADKQATVRLAALDAYSSLFESDSIEALEAAFTRGPEDLRSEALVRAALEKKLSHPKLEPVVAQALDDADAGVRRTAFVLRVLERPALAARLEHGDQDFLRAVREVSRHAAAVLAGFTARHEGKANDEATQQARKRLGDEVPAKTPLTEDDLSPLLSAMACRTPDTALRGARGLAELGDTRALGALLQLSRESDKHIRREAAVALQALSDPRAKKRLIWMLDDADADVRSAALEAYSKLERDPLELAEAALRSSQKDIRVQGLSQLVKQAGSRTPSTDALLGDALEDESPDVRAEAFKTLWSWHTKDPEKALGRALSARFADLRLRAVQELEALGKDHPWAVERLLVTVGDRDEAVALAAFQSAAKLRGKQDAAAPLAAMSSLHGPVRAAGAKGSRGVPVEQVRSALMKQLQDEHAEARSEALAALDKLLPKEGGPLYAGLQSPHYDLKVQAAELLADRHDEQLIDPVRTFLGDKELAKTIAAPTLHDLRYRASKALGTLASPRTLKYLATELLKDDDGSVREQASRGLAAASKKGDEGFLLDALGHKDVAVRSWAAEGLARLGDVRALPVLTGHLRHEHAPVRVGAIVSFAALGPEGYGGMLQGLEDTAPEVQDLVFRIVLARDLRAFRRNEPPDLLTSALSSQRAEVRYAAARALELRGDPGRYMAHLIEALTPPKPEKAAAMKDWPEEAEQARLMVAVAEALTSDQPEVRYGATQALRHRSKPVEFFREAEKVAKLRPASQSPGVDTTPKQVAADDFVRDKSGWLRRLFRQGDGAAANDQVPDAEQQRLRWLAFGAYVGLLRQAAAGDEEGSRVRRDSIERIVELAQQGHVSATAALPALGRALDDPHYQVRKAAFAGLKRLFAEGADEPLVMAMASHHDDVARGALDELAARGDAGKKAIVRALNAPVAEVRKYAFERLEALYPKGSLEPLFFALDSDFADVRLGVLQRLSSARDERVQGALVRALRSDHDDLRLLAAELLARRKSDLAVEPLAGFLRSEEEDEVDRARTALVQLGSEAAVKALSARLAEAEEDERGALLNRLARTRSPAALDPIVQRFADESEEVRSTAFDAVLELTAIDSRRRDWPTAIKALRAAAQARDPALRKRAAEELKEGDDAGQSEVLIGLFHDRDRDVRVAAVEAYSERVIKKNAPPGPLDAVVRRGARETLLAAAEGVAHKGGQGALRPLLLFARAGEDGERERALLALGSLGDPRALAELEGIAAGGTEEAPVEPSMRQAATEALGRLYRSLTDSEVRARILERLEQGIVDSKDEMQKSSLRGLRWIGDERARARIEATLVNDDTNWRVKVEAAEQLGELRSATSEPALLKGLKDDDNDVREASYKTLRKLFPQERTRIELHALTSEDDDLSGRAAAFLAREGDAEALLPKLGEVESDEVRQKLRLGLLRRASIAAPSLVKLLGEKEPKARANAAWLAGARAEQAGNDAAALRAALLAAEDKAAAAWSPSPADAGRNEAELSAWTQALWALRQLKAREAAARLRARLGSASAPEAVRAAAAQGLAELGGADDIEALRAALRDRDASVRAAAAAGLRKLAPDRSLKLALDTQPLDPVSFTEAVAAPTASALDSEAGRRLVLPQLIVRGDGSTLAARLGKATGAELLDLMAAAGRSGGPEAIEALKGIAFDKKKYEVAERKAAYRALRRAQRLAGKAQQEKRA